VTKLKNQEKTEFVELEADQLLIKLNTGEGLTDREKDTVIALLDLVRVSPDLQPGSAGRVSLGSGANQRIAEVRLPGVDEIYSLIKVAGRAGLKEHRNVVESFLGHEDPLTVSLVLDILCERLLLRCLVNTWLWVKARSLKKQL